MQYYHSRAHVIAGALAVLAFSGWATPVKVSTLHGVELQDERQGTQASTYFPTLPPDSELPDGGTCAARVRPHPREHRELNRLPNNTRGYRINYVDGADEEGQKKFAHRVDGGFTGTTDEIFQWAACKWGFDEDVVRAVAVAESYWRQSQVGDGGESFGVMQVRCLVHEGTCPAAQYSTAFNVDYALAWRRSCFEGNFRHWVPGEAEGDEWGCVGLWYSGKWNENNAGYVEAVKRHLSDKPWLSR